MKRLAATALKGIALITIASGASQLFAPAFVLRVVGGDITATTTHFFAIIGMFMVLFGGVMWQAVRTTPPARMPLFWAALQKLGASLAVGIAVVHGLFAPISAAVALFDLFSGVLALWYWREVRTA